MLTPSESILRRIGLSPTNSKDSGNKRMDLGKENFGDFNAREDFFTKLSFLAEGTERLNAQVSAIGVLSMVRGLQEEIQNINKEIGKQIIVCFIRIFGSISYIEEENEKMERVTLTPVNRGSLLQSRQGSIDPGLTSGPDSDTQSIEPEDSSDLGNALRYSIFLLQNEETL